MCLRESKEVAVSGDTVREATGARLCRALWATVTIWLWLEDIMIGRLSTKKGYEPINVLKRSLWLLSGEWTGRSKNGSRDGFV